MNLREILKEVLPSSNYQNRMTDRIDIPGIGSFTYDSLVRALQDKLQNLLNLAKEENFTPRGITEEHLKMIRSFWKAAREYQISQKYKR